MAKSPEDMAAAMVANLKDKTGKDLAAWQRIVGKTELGKHGEIVAFLKSEHGVTHGYANLIARSHLDAGVAASGDDLVDAQYSGPKADLRAIYDAVLARAQKLGKDVEIAPKKAYVSLRRSKQFALIQPSTKTRVDLGLNLKGVAPNGRLEASGSFNSMCTHRIRLTSVADVDAEVGRYLKQAWAGA